MYGIYIITIRRIFLHHVHECLYNRIASVSDLLWVVIIF